MSLFLTGVWLGLPVGLFIGAHLARRWTKPLIDDLKEEINYWYRQAGR